MGKGGRPNKKFTDAVFTERVTILVSVEQSKWLKQRAESGATSIGELIRAMIEQEKGDER